VRRQWRRDGVEHNDRALVALELLDVGSDRGAIRRDQGVDRIQRLGRRRDAARDQAGQTVGAEVVALSRKQTLPFGYVAVRYFAKILLSSL